MVLGLPHALLELGRARVGREEGAEPQRLRLLLLRLLVREECFDSRLLLGPRGAMAGHLARDLAEARLNLSPHEDYRPEGQEPQQSERRRGHPSHRRVA